MAILRKFFTENDDLQSIIYNYLQKDKIIKINKISTGWTNIVFDVQTKDNGNYIFRFPRNDFFADKINKDVKANNFLINKINLKTVKMSINSIDNKQFSVHQKIEGIPLINRLDELSDEKLNNIAIEISEFFYKLHNIDINIIPDILKIRLSDFLINLPKVNKDKYNYSDLLELQQDEENNLVFVHGDLNAGNIILDNNDNICAFIDFAFVGLSDIYCDLSRISCRVGDVFFNKILTNYEKISNKNLDLEKIRKRNKMWKYIEEQYILYMKKNFPEIKC